MAETTEKEKSTPSELENRFPDVDAPHLEAIVQLLYHMGFNVEDIHEVNATPYVEVTIGNQTWFVMNEQEADEFSETSVIESYDEMGEEGFENIEWKDFVQNEGDFDIALSETIQNYIEDIRSAPSTNPDFDTRLDEEMAGKNAASEDEFEDSLRDDWLGDRTPIDWYIDEFGKDSFKEIAIVDTTALAKYVIETDGRGSIIAGYDGEEVELGKDYYGYRTD